MAKKAPAGKGSLQRLIERYYADLAEFTRQNVPFEMGTRYAFHRLMADAGKAHRWTLVAEQEKKIGGKTIRPDGTFKDEMNLVRGYWEAKDTADTLEAEIEKKRKAGYPLSNIIFEDNKTAILFPNGQRILAVDMQDPARLAELITQFFRYVEPEIEEFEQAVDEFKERVPDLAEGLKTKIEQAHRGNNNFKQAFQGFGFAQQPAFDRKFDGLPSNPTPYNTLQQCLTSGHPAPKMRGPPRFLRGFRWQIR